MKAFYRCANIQRHGQCSLIPVAPQRMPYTKHLLDTAHNVGKQSEMKSDSYHYFICFVFSSSECLWRVCICTHLHVWAPVSQGTQAAAFAWADGMSMPGASPQSREEKLENPQLGHSYPGTRVCLEWGQTCGEVSRSVNSGFCFLWCPGPGLPWRRQSHV